MDATGNVISIQAWRERHGLSAADRLEDAVEELDGLLASLPPSRLSDPDIERELLAITGAVSIGLLEDAAQRAERLRERLVRRIRKGG
jgi:hypothetical protein